MVTGPQMRCWLTSCMKVKALDELAKFNIVLFFAYRIQYMIIDKLSSLLYMRRLGTLIVVIIKISPTDLLFRTTLRLQRNRHSF